MARLTLINPRLKCGLKMICGRNQWCENRSYIARVGALCKISLESAGYGPSQFVRHRVINIPSLIEVDVCSASRSEHIGLVNL